MVQMAWQLHVFTSGKNPCKIIALRVLSNFKSQKSESLGFNLNRNFVKPMLGNCQYSVSTCSEKLERCYISI